MGTIDTGDTAWMLIATGLVFFMIPGLGFFESGLIRSKNSLNVIMQMWTGACVLSVLYYCVCFTLIFSEGKFIGGWKYGFMMNVPATDTFSSSQTIPAFLFAVFQMQFFDITPLLISGAWVERFKWRPFLIFIVCWNLLVYTFVAHWVWGNGFMADWGVIDFAGGIVIHTTAGVSSLVTALMLGKRAHFTKEVSPCEVNEAHNIPMSIMGAGMLWFGWFGFNGGSALGANAVSVAALFNSQIASSTAGVTWLLIGMFREKRASSVGIITGSVAGLACITPASGYVSTQCAFTLGIVAGVASYLSIMLLKEKLRIDDALDVSSVHGVTGMIGSICAGIFATSTVNPSGPDRSGRLIGYQFLAVLIAGAWAGFWTFVILAVMKRIPHVGLATSVEKQEAGLDSVYHKETAYAAMDSVYSTTSNVSKQNSVYQKSLQANSVNNVVRSNVDYSGLAATPGPSSSTNNNETEIVRVKVPLPPGEYTPTPTPELGYQPPTPATTATTTTLTLA